MDPSKIQHTTAVRASQVLVVLSLALVLPACGNDVPSSPPGSADNPVVATQPSQSPAKSSGSSTSAEPARGLETKKPGAPGTDSAESQGPGYQALVDRQSSKPRSRFTPCDLVTRAEAAAIAKKAVQVPVEAPQGPTCIFRTDAGSQLATVAVQTVGFRKLRPQIRKRAKVSVSGATAYCGTYGQPMLYVPLAHGRVLSIAATCDIARQFAAKAVPRL